MCSQIFRTGKSTKDLYQKIKTTLNSNTWKFQYKFTLKNMSWKYLCFGITVILIIHAKITHQLNVNICNIFRDGHETSWGNTIRKLAVKGIVVFKYIDKECHASKKKLKDFILTQSHGREWRLNHFSLIFDWKGLNLCRINWLQHNNDIVPEQNNRNSDLLSLQTMPEYCQKIRYKCNDGANLCIF